MLLIFNKFWFVIHIVVMDEIIFVDLKLLRGKHRNIIFLFIFLDIYIFAERDLFRIAVLINTPVNGWRLVYWSGILVAKSAFNIKGNFLFFRMLRFILFKLHLVLLLHL